MIAVLAVSFASTGSTAPKFLKNAKEKITGKDEKKKAPAVVINKEPAETATEVNPLLGPWNFEKRGDTGEITFTADKVVVSLGEGKDKFVMEMKYKFSKSPLILEYKIKNKTYKLTMNYEFEEGYLNCSFPNQNNKPIPGFPDEFSLCPDGNGEHGPIKIVDCPIYAAKGIRQTQNVYE